MSLDTGNLSAPIQVAGHGTIANKVAFATGIVGLIIAGIFLGNNEPEIAAVIAVVAVTVLLTSVVIAVNRRRRRAWVLVGEQGFVYRDRNGQSEVADDQVVGVNVLTTPNYVQGKLKSYTNEAELKVADRIQPIRLTTTTKIDHVDPLSSLIRRTIDNYQERAEMALDAGARLSGRGWSLGREDITTEGQDGTRIPIRDLVAIDTIDGEHKIWRKDHDDPIFSVPEKSENAFLLVLLLGPKVNEAAQEREFDLSQPGLGRQIFRRASGRFGRCFGWFCIAQAILAVPITVIAFVVNQPLFIGLSLAGAFVAPFSLLLGLFLVRNEFRCHERGVYRRMLLKGRELRFEHVESFRYAAMRQYYNGAYAGTSLEVALFPEPSSGKKKLRYSRMVQNADEALEALREHLTWILVPKLAQQLTTHGSLQWMPNVRMTPEGLYYKPKGFVGRKKEEEFLSYADVHGFDIQDGTFHVWKKGADKSVIHELTAEPNFYPGYLLLSRIDWAAHQEAESAES